MPESRRITEEAKRRAHVAELSKLAEMYTGMVRDASKPIREASRQSR